MKFFKIFTVGLVYLFITFSSGVVSAQGQQIEGIVIEEKTGEPIPGVNVIIDELNIGTATNSEGIFSFSGINSGSYTLTIRSIGYKTLSLRKYLPTDSIIRIELDEDILISDEIIITSSPIGRSAKYQPAQAMNVEMLQRKAAPSLGEILDDSPGVTTRSFGSGPARPVIRGFDGDRILVLQNGERMGDLSGTAVDHAVSLDPMNLDRVEIVRGPASLLYGSSAIGGVVNLFSNDLPRDWDVGTGGRVSSQLATVNEMGAGMIRLNHNKEHFAATGRVLYRTAGDLRTPDGRLPDTALENFSFGGGAGFKSKNFQTGIAVSTMDYNYGLPELIDDPDEEIEIDMKRWNLQSISKFELDGFLKQAELRIHYSDYSHDEIERMFNQNGGKKEELGISFDQQNISSSLVFRHRPVGVLEGAFGLSANYNSLRVGGEEALTPDANSYFLAAYFFEELKVNEFLRFKAGSRLELKETFVRTNEIFSDASQFEDRSDIIFSGAAGLNFTTGGWEAGLQVAQAFRTPNVEELYSNAPHLAAGSFDIGDPGLENEVSIGTDFFITYQTKRVKTQTSFFLNSINNFVDFSPTGEIDAVSGLPVFVYGSKDVRLFGFETSGSILLSDKLQAKVEMDYVRGRERSGEKNNLPFIPPFRTMFSLDYDTNDFWVGPRIKWVGKQDKVAPNEETTDGYLLAGLDTGYRFDRQLTLSLRIDNLFNERYKDHLSRVEDRDNPMPGRNLNIMLRWEF